MSEYEVPKEAVEAASMAGIGPERWAELPEETREDWRITMREALAVAAPLIIEANNAST